MSFASIGDIKSCAKFAYQVYLYGFSKVKNASTQYTEFGQDVYRLHENLGQVEKVFTSVQESARGPIPTNSDFHNTSALNAILDDPFNTIRECNALLNRRNAFAADSGFIRNIYWNLSIEAEVTSLHNRIKFHNVKIIALLQPLQIKLLLDIKSVVQLYGDNILAKLAALEARIFGEVLSGESEVATRCDQIQIPEFLLQLFEDTANDARPDLGLDDSFPMQLGINAFLGHYKDESSTATFAGGFLLPPPTQSPEHYLRMIKSIWIIQRVQACSEYIEACGPISRNRLLQCFVEGLAQKCLEEFNRFAQRLPGGLFKVRDEPSEDVLRPLGNEAFSIWPKVLRPLDPFDIALRSADSLKIVLRAPLRYQTQSTRSKELLLLRHDATLLEMLTKETSETNQPTFIQTKNIDLKIVSLNPIYADPDATSPNIDLGLHSVGSRGPDTLLSFRGYNDLYQFQEAVTGYRPIMDLLDIDILIQQDKPTVWRGRAQLWNLQRNQSGPSRNRDSTASTGDARLSGVQSRASRASSSVPTSHSSTMSFQTRTSELTAVTSVLASENDSGIGIDARTFEPPKQPLLVLFLRARRQRSRQVGQFVNLIKIPMGEKSVYLDSANCCRCHKSQKHECRHSELTGPKKTFGKNPINVQRYCEGPMLNLALLGVYHELKDEEPEQKINFINFTFKSAAHREKFDTMFVKYQQLYKDKMSAYTREKSSIRFGEER